MSDCPMSSPNMTRMFGFCVCWATAGKLPAAAAIETAISPRQAFLTFLMLQPFWLGVNEAGCPEREPGTTINDTPAKTDVTPREVVVRFCILPGFPTAERFFLESTGRISQQRAG